MGKTFYVKINHTHTTSCCRIHIEFSNHFDVFRHICVLLHFEFVLKDCDMNEPPRSLREFISNILCEIGDNHNFTRHHAWMVHSYFVVHCNFYQLVNIWIVHMKLEMK